MDGGNATITPQELAAWSYRLRMADTLRNGGSSASQMMAPMAPMPAGDSGPNMQTPYAGIADAGSTLNRAMGQKLLSGRINDAIFSNSPQGIPLNANVTPSQAPQYFGGNFGQRASNWLGVS